jgi:hypothetical protein
VPTKERRVRRWEREEVTDRAQAMLDSFPGARQRCRGTVEHPFGTIKAWMVATHFKTTTLAHVATQMALHVLADNIKRAIAIIGVPELIKGIAPFLLFLVNAMSLRGACQKPYRPFCASYVRKSRNLHSNRTTAASEALRRAFSHGLIHKQIHAAAKPAPFP